MEKELDKLNKICDESKEEVHTLARSNADKEIHITELKDDFHTNEKKCEELKIKVIHTATIDFLLHKSKMTVSFSFSKVSGFPLLYKGAWL